MSSSSTARLSAALRALPGGVVVCDRAGTIVSASDRFCALADTDSEGLVGSPLHLVLDAAWDGVGDDEQVAETLLHAASGERIAVRVRSAVVEGSGERVHYVEDRRALQRAVDRAAYLATHDPLTGALNRQTTVDRLQRLIASDDAAGVAVVVLDINRFGDVNGRLGHRGGDSVLVTVARRLSGLHHDSVLGRLGADEFVVVLSCADTHDPAELADDLHRAIRAPIERADGDVHLSASMGIAVLGQRPADAEELLQRADIALGEAKQLGAATRFADVGVASAARSALAREADIASMIRRGRVDVAFQPIIDGDGRITAMEALVRVGQHSACETVTAATRLGLLDRMTEAVIADGCATLPLVQAAAGHAVRLQVNVSGPQLAGGWLRDRALAAVRAHGLSPADLVIELTEQAALTDVGGVIGLADAGFAVAIDDFGTGYSSFSYLRDLPVSQVKIDMSFLHRAADDEASAKVLSGMVALCSGLGLEVVCEGVETTDHRDIALAAGCSAWQGYLLARPMSSPQLLTELPAWQVHQIGASSMSRQLGMLGMEDLMLFSRIGEGRYAHIGGVGRGSGWAGIVEIDLAAEPFIANGLARHGRITTLTNEAFQIVGPYHARSSVIVRHDESDSLVLMGHQHARVRVEPDDPRIDAIVEAAVAQIREVSPAKPLADELEVLQAVHELLQWSGDEVGGALTHLVSVAVEHLSCDVGMAYLPGAGTVTVGIGQTVVGPQPVGQQVAVLPLDASVLLDAMTLPDVRQSASSTDLPGRLVERLDIRSWMALPIGAGAGVLLVAHTAERPRGFTGLCQRLGHSLVQSSEVLFDAARRGASLRADVARAEQAARLDPLTGLGNRLDWEETVEKLASSPDPVAVAIIDLNQFKALNDSLGHAEGDRMLARTGAALRAVLPDDAVAARIGGDEFGVLMPGGTPTALHDLASAIVRIAGRAQPLDVSVGTAHAPSGRELASALVAADRDMYLNKGGRDDGTAGRLRIIG